jgi:hypothetical protein
LLNLRHRNKKFESNFSANNAAQDAGYRKLESSKRCWPLSDYANRISENIAAQDVGVDRSRISRAKVVLEYALKLREIKRSESDLCFERRFPLALSSLITRSTRRTGGGAVPATVAALLNKHNRITSPIGALIAELRGIGISSRETGQGDQLQFERWRFCRFQLLDERQSDIDH